MRKILAILLCRHRLEKKAMGVLINALVRASNALEIVPKKEPPVTLHFLIEIGDQLRTFKIKLKHS